MTRTRRRVRRRTRAKRNPLYRAKSGKFTARKTRKKLRRKGKCGWANNPCRHNKGYHTNMRRRRRTRRNPLYRSPHTGRFSGRRRKGYKTVRRRRRRARCNAVLPIPFSPNPYGRNQDIAGAITAPFEKILDPDFLLGTALPTVGGFTATHIVAYQASKMLGIDYTGFAKHITRLAAAGLVAGAGGLITRDADIAAGFLVGGVTAALAGIIEETIGDTLRLAELGVPTEGAGGVMLGVGEDEGMKQVIAEAVKEQLVEDGGMSDYATSEQIAASPQLSGGMADFVTQEQLSTSPQLSGVGGVAHMSMVVDQDADAALV